MVIMVWLSAVAAALELVLCLVWGKRFGYKFFVLLVAMLSAGAAGGLLGAWPNLWSGLLLFLSLFRALNSMRILKGRMHEQYLRRAARRTSLYLVGLQGVVALAWWAWNTWGMSGHVVWACVAAAQFLGAVVALVSIGRSLRKTTWSDSDETGQANVRLPSLTVAIPARNESDDLQACLQSLILSDYPKLEIIVLDDCSQLRRTPEIIRSFAHDGVRFIQGDEPLDAWLPKNQAYQRLLDEASGELIMFCGVDVRFTARSLRELVIMLQQKHKRMLSLLPLPAPAARPRFGLTQAMRYWWELVPPRRFLNRPPVLSTCWIAGKTELQKAGGFAAVSRSIVPEAYFAKRLITTDQYSFRRASTSLGITSSKLATARRETAIRVRYPQLHRRPENVALAAAAELFFLVLPFVLATNGWWLGIGHVATALSVLASALLIVSYERMALATRVNSWPIGLIALPVVVLTDIVLLLVSMWQYEFSTVEWKERNICIPVMHVVPHLPKLS